MIETFDPPKPQKGVHIDHWHWTRKYDVKMWLVENFGVNGDRWCERNDFGLEDLFMDEDVYTWFMMRWGQ